MNPMLACDWVQSKVRFPCMLQPKIDGVRGLNIHGTLIARSKKEHANKHVTKLFTSLQLIGFDGELAANSETHPDLCRLTSSALRTVAGEPFVLWWIFDYVHPDWHNRRYIERYDHLRKRIDHIQTLYHELPFAQHLRAMPYRVAANMTELLDYEQECLAAGYEGICGRDPESVVKQGRCTAIEGGLWRIKRFVEDEAVVIEIKEGQRNDNEAQINELGKTFRTTHQENMVPNSQVGTLVCQHKTRGIINVSPGEMDVDTRKLYFVQPELILKKTITFKTFPKGVKDKPRFPTFKCIREDL